MRTASPPTASSTAAGVSRAAARHARPLGHDAQVAFDDEAQTEIEQFRQEIIERTGDPGQAECLSDQDPLREVLNTVGVEGRLADSTSAQYRS